MYGHPPPQDTMEISLWIHLLWINRMQGELGFGLYKIHFYVWRRM